MTDQDFIVPPGEEADTSFIDEHMGKKPGKAKIPWFQVLVMVALAGIYLLFFLFMPWKTEKETVPTVSFQQGDGMKIALINSDSLKANYQLVKDLHERLEARFNHLNQDISKRQTSLESKANELQSKYESKLISLEQAQKMDDQLKAESQQLYQLNQEYSDQMEEEELRLNQIYIDSIHSFLKRFNLKYHFDYILGYSKGSGILFAKDTLDITPYVVEALNREYFQVNPQSKKDSK
ncbi:MAG TPA: OmpH family outer membrane protein [Bacteroidales bacterium]|nr:OmpH family outer membrane protein [Bacteroidales bacterium]HSA42829.1 OmpH family outer membrane protein [Bacteroidales bacterium]